MAGGRRQAWLRARQWKSELQQPPNIAMGDPRTLKGGMGTDEPMTRFRDCRRKKAAGQAVLQTAGQTSCRVGRKMISFTSTSLGWLMANSTQRAKLEAGISLLA